VVQLAGDGRASVVHHSPAVAAPNHNLLEWDGGIVFCDTNTGGLRVAWPDGRPDVFIRVPGAPAFVRGLAPLADGEFLTGSQCPPAVHRVDIEARRVVRTFRLRGVPSESVYGISIVPEAFENPQGTALRT